HRFANPLLDRGDELFRDDAADDTVLEHEARALLGRLEIEHAVTVLAVAARLANELVLTANLAADRFAVSDLGFADVTLDLELALQPVDDDLEVQLTHTSDDGLTRLVVGISAERRVFVGQFLQRDTQFVDVALRLRL